MENGVSRNVTRYLRGLAILIVLASHYAEWLTGCITMLPQMHLYLT